MTTGERIIAYLAALAKAGTYPVRTWDAATGLVTTAGSATPKTVLVNETGSVFAQDKKMGRRLALQRTQWTYQLLLSFQQEVSLETFENELADTVPTLPKSDGSPSCLIFLTSTRVIHPVQQNNARGTEATVVFTVTQGRV